MTNTFLNRVSAERRVLTTVNKYFSGIEELTGLSRSAILRWQSTVGLPAVRQILPLLTELGEQCQRLSDRSNETFMSLEEKQAAKIEEQLVELRHALEKYREDE